VDFESLKMAAAVTLPAPFVPLLFMGEEYGEERPVLYFTSHGDHDLIEAVRKGRCDEFAVFRCSEIPDPQSEATFARSKLNYRATDEPQHRILLNLHREQIALRRKFQLGRRKPEVECDTQQQTIRLDYREPEVSVVYHFGDRAISLTEIQSAHSGAVILRSGDPPWREPAASPAEPPAEEIVLGRNSFAVFARAVSAQP
jgi:maltooligosyltrehalose trehalohydrolase